MFLAMIATWLLFRYGVVLLATCLPGPESSQCERFSVLSLLTQLGQTKRPHYLLVPATPTILSFLASEMPRLHTQIAWAGSLKPQIAWALPPPYNPPLKVQT